MTRWQRRTRVLIAIFAVAFAVAVAFAFKRRAPVAPPAPVVRTDPGAVAEITAGRVERFKLSREDVRVESEKQLTYADGSTKLMGVRIVTEGRDGRTFTVIGKEGQVAGNESTIVLDGDVRLVSSDGMTARTEHAVYTDSDGMVKASGPVQVQSGRIAAAGIGMSYDKNNAVLWILDRATVHVAPDEKSPTPTDVTSSTAAFPRREKYVRFEGGVRIERQGQVIECTTGTAYLSDDEKRIERIELRENSRITMSQPTVGALKSLAGRDMNLNYRADGETLEHAVILGGAVIQLAGEAGPAGRQIAANAIDVALAADGSTPTALVGRDNVQLTLPAETGMPSRTVRSASVDAQGQPGRGLTRAEFGGNVQYREQGDGIDRGATATTLDAALKPGLGAIEEARFAHAVRFVDGKLTALAALARYDPEKGVLELTGSEPGAVAPHVMNDRIAVDATRIDVTLEGPKLKATGRVRSVVQPARNQSAAHEVRLPSMLKQDQPVNITGGALAYDGMQSKATYIGGAQLWQGDTTVKSDRIVLDDRSGDLSAVGSVTTATMLEQVDKDKKKERVRSIGTAREFTYEDGIRRATYADGAHLSGPQGDLTAAKIELYLRPSGDELERAEAYDNVALREPDRKVTGLRLTYTTADERYVVAGAPVTVLDECARETKGKTVTYLKSADTIVIDGNELIRTQTKGSATCQ